MTSKAASKKAARKKKRTLEKEELDRFDSLPWSSSHTEDDHYAFVSGSSALDGGFLSLEEIDEVDYVERVPMPGKVYPDRKGKSKKVKVDDEVQERVKDVEESGDLKPERKVIKKKQKKKKQKTVASDTQKIEDVEPVTGDEVEEEIPNYSEFHAWSELRLHPQLMKSIYQLGFKEPTPIQKACFPVAAHQGKDVIGAAETGSGKTLAFGLPILQRLLEERDKIERTRGVLGEDSDRFGPKGVLRALIITPTRELAVQVTDHLKEASKDMSTRVVPIVGGMSTEKQERLLKGRPEIVVGTPGRLWELMSSGEKHLTELHSLSFFVLDEADRMIENGHFRELQSIIDLLPTNNNRVDLKAQNVHNCVTHANVQKKKRQTFVFSATLSLSADFRKKLKRSSVHGKVSTDDGVNSLEKLSERAGMNPNASVIDLTNSEILAHKLEESFIECSAEDKDAFLYYILRVHGQGRTIVFCTSVAALRHISSILKVVEVNVCTLHAQMQQRARLKAVDRFRSNAHGILVATDVAARGLDIPGVRTVVHYQLPHSSEVYVHRSGRTARAHMDGCSIALIAPNEISKFASLCKSFSKESFQRFPVEDSYMPEVMKRMSLAYQIDKITRKHTQEKTKRSWLERNAEAIELTLDEDESEDERVKLQTQKKAISRQLNALQEELKKLLSRPLQPKTLSRRYLAGAGVSPLLHNQLEELARQKRDEKNSSGNREHQKLAVIGQDCVEPLQALRSSGQEVWMNNGQLVEKLKNVETLKRKRKEMKKSLRDQRRKQRKMSKGEN